MIKVAGIVLRHTVEVSDRWAWRQNTETITVQDLRVEVLDGVSDISTQT